LRAKMNKGFLLTAQVSKTIGTEAQHTAHVTHAHATGGSYTQDDAMSDMR
jgi:hypothetical protein